VLSRTIPHTVPARSEWSRWLRERQAEGIEIWAAIERPMAASSTFCWTTGRRLPRQPKSLDRARDRFRVGGAKSDPFDAQVLALFCAVIMPPAALYPSSEAAQELRADPRPSRQVKLQTGCSTSSTSP